jgi:hypothetical protein
MKHSDLGSSALGAAPRTRRSSRHLHLLALLVAGGFAACGQGEGPPGSTSGATAGQEVAHPDPSLSKHFIVDANAGGHATALRVLSLKWGRLVNIVDSTGELQNTDFVVGEDINTTAATPAYPAGEYTLTTNPVTEITTVTIGAPYTPSTLVNGVETSAYQKAFKKLDKNLGRIDDVPPDANPVDNPFPLIPRNAAVVVAFNDILDPNTVSAETVRMLVGYPPNSPLFCRVIKDINHGDLADFAGDDALEFYSTRVILDTTVSQVDAITSNPPLPPNPIGLPPSVTTTQPNVLIRIPTKTGLNQVTILRNPTGHGLSFTNNGSHDTLSATRDIWRSARAGGSGPSTPDANNGFLFDNVQPSVLGTQSVLVLGAPAPVGDEFIVNLEFDFPTCASALKVGDVLQQPGFVAQVVEASDPPLNGVVEAHYRVVAGSALAVGLAEISTVFDPVANFGKEACFVRFTNLAEPPNKKVATDSAIVVRFSEPMDPAGITPFDNMTITRVAAAPSATQVIVGSISPSTDLREFTFFPTVPFKHRAAPPTAESYFFNLIGGVDGVTDLAGNALTGVLPQVNFTIDPAAIAQDNGSIVLRFNSSDELFGDEKQEIRSAQLLFDLQNGVLRPRSVTRQAATADRSQPVPSNMPQFPGGVQTPLSRLGSKMHTLWRYCDVGFSLLDESTTNMDVEGLSWAPANGAALQDTYGRFEISLAHCKFLPDESFDNINLLPFFANSGLVAQFANNQADPFNDPLRVVHSRERGYNVFPGDIFEADTGTRLMPFPLNRGIPKNQFKYYTWRDTALQVKAAPAAPQGTSGCPGAELPIVVTITGLGEIGVPYPAGAAGSSGNVPTIGLPLLMEFKCFPDSDALGLNAFDILLANTNSPQPNFRAFSTGGTSTSGDVEKDPDLQVTANGGFSPTSTPPGAPTPGVDNSFYVGQADLVVRISRAHTIWFDTGSGSNPTYSAHVVEPRESDLPFGTQLVLAFRGAANATLAQAKDADALDAYGDAKTPANPNGVVTFFEGDKTWKTKLSDLNGARFFQARVSFIGNTETNLVPELSALGFAFRL